jgi:hypothetical protein
MSALLDAPSPEFEAIARSLERAGGEPVAAFMRPMADGEPFPDFDLPEIPAADPRAELGQLRELYRMEFGDHLTAELERVAQALAERGQPPAAGGATGQQATAYMSNLPAEGAYVMNNDAFAVQTERNDMPLEQKPIAALGGAPIDLRLPNVGVPAAAASRAATRGRGTSSGGSRSTCRARPRCSAARAATSVSAASGSTAARPKTSPRRRPPRPPTAHRTRA